MDPAAETRASTSRPSGGRGASAGDPRNLRTGTPVRLHSLRIGRVVHRARIGPRIRRQARVGWCHVQPIHARADHGSNGGLGAGAPGPGVRPGAGRCAGPGAGHRAGVHEPRSAAAGAGRAGDPTGPDRRPEAEGPRRRRPRRRRPVPVLAARARHAGHADILREQLDGLTGIRADDLNQEPRDNAWWTRCREQIESAARDSAAHQPFWPWTPRGTALGRGATPAPCAARSRPPRCGRWRPAWPGCSRRAR